MATPKTVRGGSASKVRPSTKGKSKKRVRSKRPADIPTVPAGRCACDGAVAPRGAVAPEPCAGRPDGISVCLKGVSTFTPFPTDGGPWAITYDPATQTIGFSNTGG